MRLMKMDEPVLEDGVQVVIKGLKSQKIQIVKQQASQDYLRQLIGM
jgi:hypothetical protein